MFGPDDYWPPAEATAFDVLWPDDPEWRLPWPRDYMFPSVEEAQANMRKFLKEKKRNIDPVIPKEQTGPRVPIPDDVVLDHIAWAIQQLDKLSALGEGERLPWPGQAEGVGWDMGALFIAGRLVQAGNSGMAGYGLDEAEADFMEHAPPAEGSFSPKHKWSEAIKYVRDAPLDYDPASGDFDDEGIIEDGSKLDPSQRMVSGETHNGQVRMAYRLALKYQDRLLFVKGVGWHFWDGKRWAVDELGEADRAVIEVLRLALADSFGDKRLKADISKCESASGIRGVLSIAASLESFAVPADQMDADPFLLNCANGTLDLRTRELRPFSPKDHMTKMARGAYDPAAGQTVWREFLEQIIPDPLERDYLQRVIGQATYGAVREHLFPVLTGTGANGKGTTYGAIAAALGEYATVINPELLMVSRNGPGGPEMMVLRGARLVVASELDKDRILNDSLMKRLTGGDQLTARHLFKEPVTWSPTHQLLYVTNHKPQTTGDDEAVWRRMRIIPFDVVIPREQRDGSLPDTLLLHADAILTWAVQGFFEYEDGGGMREPESVLAATQDYRQEQDDVARFIDEMCEVGRGRTCSFSELWLAWSGWRDDDGSELLSKRAFGASLTKRGFEASRGTANVPIRKGLRVLQATDFD